MSSGCENLPMGMVDRNFARISGVSSPMKLARSGVSPATGLTAFTRTPYGGEFHRHRARRGDHPALGGVIPAEVRARRHPGRRGDVQDAALTGGLHRRNECPRRQKDGLVVNRHHPVERLLVHILQRARLVRDAGIVYEYIKRAEMLLRRRRHRAGKPIVVYKLGRSAAGQQLAVSHTGAMIGSDAAADVLFPRPWHCPRRSIRKSV